nr:hypothetical protein [Bradyrhizobium altum]
MAVGQEQLCKALSLFNPAGYLQVEAQLKGSFKGLSERIMIIKRKRQARDA